ncbi:MAG: LytTR family transcriptional regulator [Erysipelothrix sp.]|nr:LytTR family transcriptional regulator [Erysipelothrix sp.]
MKIKIIEDPDLEEDIIIHCRVMTPEIQKFVDQSSTMSIQASSRGSDVNVDLNNVLFFETEGDAVYVHLNNRSLITRYRLYELEDALPSTFMRISKSTILNSENVSSLERNLTSNRSVQFFDSTKIVYVSRMYYSKLKTKLKERSIL